MEEKHPLLNPPPGASQYEETSAALAGHDGKESGTFRRGLHVRMLDAIKQNVACGCLEDEPDSSCRKRPL